MLRLISVLACAAAARAGTLVALHRFNDDKCADPADAGALNYMYSGLCSGTPSDFSMMYTCNSEGTSVTMAVWQAKECGGAPMYSQSYPVGQCSTAGGPGESQQFDCVDASVLDAFAHSQGEMVYVDKAGANCTGDDEDKGVIAFNTCVDPSGQGEFNSIFRCDPMQPGRFAIWGFSGANCTGNPLAVGVSRLENVHWCFDSSVKTGNSTRITSLRCDPAVRPHVRGASGL